MTNVYQSIRRFLPADFKLHEHRYMLANVEWEGICEDAVVA
jgi:hypothetical protein